VRGRTEFTHSGGGIGGGVRQVPDKRWRDRKKRLVEGHYEFNEEELGRSWAVTGGRVKEHITREEKREISRRNGSTSRRQTR